MTHDKPPQLVASLQSDLLVCRSVRAWDVGCSENAYNKSFIYIKGQKYYRNLKLPGQGNSQGQETKSCEVPLSLGLRKAYIGEKRKNQNKAPVQLSSYCYYRYADKV